MKRRLLPLLLSCWVLTHPLRAWLFPSAPTEVPDDGPAAVLLHPDAGSPCFAQGLASTSWREAGKQLARRVQWDLNESAALHVLPVSEFCRTQNALGAALVLGIDLELPEACEEKRQELEAVPARLFFNSSSGQLSSNLQSSRVKPGTLRRRVLRLMARCSEEELIWALLLLMNTYVAKVPAVQAQLPRPSGFSLAKAAALCSLPLVACGASPTCMKGLFCIALCHLDDQTCAYQCLLKYDSWLITKFSACAFQGQNVMNFHTSRPKLPHVEPLDGFNSTAMQTGMANRILMGHLGPRNYSWLVAASSSEAYAQFPLQYQYWFPARNERFIYHAVFLAEGVDNWEWHSRTYWVLPVRPAEWLFASKDAGVHVKEHWYLLGADSSLRWMVIYFAGHAKRAGMAYRGCMLLTPDGKVPGRSAHYPIQEDRVCAD
ncbi:unnamed protein product [Effrenium voratum]|nr:unnamed protein product [Effrenium voratum]